MLHACQLHAGRKRQRSQRFDSEGRKLQVTAAGREQLRERVAVEHSLAHIAARKGARARYLGVRKNLFDLRRSGAIQNLEALHHIHREAA